MKLRLPLYRRKKKKRNRKRRQEKVEHDEELEQEVPSHSSVPTLASEQPLPAVRIVTLCTPIKYATRVKKWFDAAWLEEIQPSQRSIAYHTFNPFADTFIKKYGVIYAGPNKKNPSKSQETYYLPGTIKFDDGKIETVVFANAYNSCGVCYHRGFQRRGNEWLEQTVKGNYSFDFSAYKDINAKQYTIHNLKPILCPEDTEYEEGTSFITMNDTRNMIYITLFKKHTLSDSGNL